MLYLAQVCVTVRFKIVIIYARISVPCVHGQKRLDNDATG